MERRRRERTNHSLERLRGLLLQEPQQPCGDQRRAEKAEVLERTVLFLQRFKIQDSTMSSAEGPRSSRDGATAGGHSFQDGFSACLEKATHFLGPRGKGLLQTAINLDTTLALRLSRSDYVSSVTKRPKVCSPAARRPKHARTTSSALDVCGLSSSLSNRLPVRREGSARVGERTRGATGPVEARTHQTCTVSPPPSPASAFQSLLWRPWP
ncbi:hypothetical protein CRUP_000889 [Coryphaenoides rupestris]|nr:hypothetical protein CRUP_000889 [Coryphaenoides rupestris]